MKTSNNLTSILLPIRLLLKVIQAGVNKIFKVDTVDNIGIDELYDYIKS